ncbi:MAG TPA: hypothetical protein VFA11_08140 [Acidimicrobiales bacterium]|nr:hypothetical protein [Acidimicrobiales bacterium]
MGIGVSVLLIAIGAVLDFAIHTNTPGFNLNTIGVILMAVGGIGLLVALMVGYGPWAGRRETTVVDGAGPAVAGRRVRRETYVD